MLLSLSVWHGLCHLKGRNIVTVSFSGLVESNRHLEQHKNPVTLSGDLTRFLFK